MPGIAGIIKLNGTACPHESGIGIEQLTSSLVREPDYACASIVTGPDACSTILAPALSRPVFGIAHHNASGIRAGFYGEFFGRDFRDLDGTEIARKIIGLYEQHGERLPHYLDGSFVVMICDPRDGSVLLFNDHSGSRPLFYTAQNGYLYFGPEPKAVAHFPGIQATVDPLAIVTFLSQGNMLACQSYYREIRALPPGSLVYAARAGMRVERYYRYFPCGEDCGRTLTSYIEELSAILREAVAKRAHHVEHAIVPISGGFDSRGILACLAESSRRRLHTVSWGTDEATPGADAFIGRKLAARFGAEHYFIKRDPADLPTCIEEMVERVDGMTADPAVHYGELAAMRVLRRDTGSEYLFRGDEVFGFTGAAHDEHEALGRIGVRDVVEYPALVRLLAPSAPVAAFRELLAEISKECPLTDFTARKDYHYFYQRTFNYLHRATYYKLSVLDVGNPWLDKDVLEFYRSVPVRYRVNKLLYRRTLQTMFPDVMALPMADRHSLENWGRVLATDQSLQRFLRHHLLAQTSPIYEFMARDALQEVLAAACRGVSIPSVKLRLLSAVKRRIMRRAPALYRLLKSNTPASLRTAAISSHDLLFRALVLKLWFDRCA